MKDIDRSGVRIPLEAFSYSVKVYKSMKNNYTPEQNEKALKDFRENSKKIVDPHFRIMYDYKMGTMFTEEELKVLEFCDRSGIRF